MAKQRNHTEHDINWADLEQVWKGMGPDRSMRSLQAYVKNKLGYKMDLQLLVAEATRRNWQVRALEFDKRLMAEVDAKTAESLVQSLVNSRLNGIANLSKRADKVGEAFDKYLDGAMTRIGLGKFDPSEFTALINAYTKLEQMKQKMEVPVLPDDVESDDFNTKITPEKMASALMHISKGRSLTISDLHNDGKVIELKPNSADK